MKRFLMIAAIMAGLFCAANADSAFAGKKGGGFHKGHGWGHGWKGHGGWGYKPYYPYYPYYGGYGHFKKFR